MGGLKKIGLVLLLLVPFVITACDAIALLLTVLETTDPPQWEKVTAFSGEAAGDQFGYAVDISANYAIVGVPYFDGVGAEQGQAKIYAKKEGEWDWRNPQTITAPAPAAGQYFGSNVAISDDHAVVRLGGVSAIQIFDRSGDTWVWSATFSAGTYFGSALDVSGNFIVAGDYSNNEIRVYEYNGSWSLVFPQTESGRYGFSVSICKDYMAVGADESDGLETNSGTVYLYQYSTGWIEIDTLQPSKETANGYFGRSVSITDDDLVISERGTARVYFYHRRESTWSLSQTGAIEGVGVGDDFGWPVSIQSRIALASTKTADNNRGAVYILEQYGDQWYYRGSKLLHDQPTVDDQFGSSASVWGDYLIVGAQLDDTGVGADVGTVFVFIRE